MTGEIALFAAIAFLGLALSAVYSGLETGLYTINRVRLMVRASHGERAAERLRDLIQNPRRMLSTILIGNNIANYAGSFGIAAILDLYGIAPGRAILINAAILIPLLFVFGETLPKDLFRTHTDQWSYRLAGFLAWSGRLFTWTALAPIVQGFGLLIERLSGADATAALTGRQRVSHLIREGVGAGLISEAQTTLVDRALVLRDLTVASEMVPWTRVAKIEADADRHRRRTLISRHPYTRLPVVDAAGRVVGVISALDALLDPEKPLGELAQPPLTLHPAMPVLSALQRLRAERCVLAIVTRPGTDEPIGIVTLKDLIEPLTGELAAW